MRYLVEVIPRPGRPQGLISGLGSPSQHVVDGAQSPREAAEQIIKGTSVLYLERGVDVDVYELPEEAKQRFWARYDAPPLTESHGGTDAKLIVGESR